MGGSAARSLSFVAREFPLNEVSTVSQLFIVRRLLVPVLCALLPVSVLVAQAAPERPGVAASHRPEVPGVHGLVTTGGPPLAAMTGARILMKGGNAIDAAVAVLATLNVVEPANSGAGGNGFMTYFDKKSGKVYSLNMTGAAPKALRAAEMTPETLGEGVKAGIVPGLFGGWVAMLERFGTMRLSTVLEPAIGYAANGHPLDKSVVRGIAGRKAFFEKFPTSAALFLPGGEVPEVGVMFKNPGLAATLRKVSDAERAAIGGGASRSAALKAAHDRFYKGDIAQEMVRFFRENGGLLRAEDFASYQPIWAEPVHTTYRGYDVYSSPSTSRGGLEVAMQLNLVEGYDLAKLGQTSPELEHLLIEAIKVAKSDIYKYVGDPKFTKMPTAGMLSKSYAAERRRLIDQARAIAFPAAGTPPANVTSDAEIAPPADEPRPRFADEAQDGHTTSFSIVDSIGNAVVITPTLGSGYGTGVVVGNTGLLLNNGMRIGSTSPYPEDVNYVRGGQIPILNNSPIVVLRDGKLALTLGSPGGETIGQTQFQTLVNVLDFKMPIQEAIEAPRFALSASPNFYRAGSAVSVRIEGRFPAATLDALRGMGHNLTVVPGFGGIGNMQGILVHPKYGTLTAGADPRISGYAIGY
jgi:gamma-glutamyltranspeptidase/glutathione hydrolase